METKLTFAKGWINFWSFLASLFQDKLEGTSTKRVVIFGAFIMFCKVINKNLESGAKIEDNLLYALIIIILGGIGLTMPEWFSPKVKSQDTPKPPDTPQA